MSKYEIIEKWKAEAAFQKSLMTSEYRTDEGKRIAFETWRTISNFVKDLENHVE